jgi:hypothetical protein
MMADDLLRCTVCSQSCCKSCVNLNGNRCCFCNFNIDPVLREVDRQLALLSVTKTHLTGNTATFSSDKIKQCPVCSVAIEKEDEDCSQMYCTNCHSIWSWNTLAIVSDHNLAHNPHYFPKTKLPEIVEPTFNQKIALKSLTRLAEEKYRYAVDTYTYRLFVVNELMDTNEFRVLISDRYALSLRHDCLTKILTSFLEGECTDGECDKALGQHNAALRLGKLPYT